MSPRLPALVAVLLLVPAIQAQEVPSESVLERMAVELAQILGAGQVEIKLEPPPEIPIVPLDERALATVPESLEVDLLIAEMNRRREEHGLAPLTAQPRLMLAAADRIRDMQSKRYFAHIAPDGTRPFTWVRLRGYRYDRLGENLAAGFESARGVITGWMGSPAHRKNLLGRFVEVGVASIEGTPGGGRHGHTVVAIYGEPQRSSQQASSQ
ncbi:MAG TPA: CAP domain-containing protein [Thermoanaerobaculia bacterium]|nr:CAP domain-containing protein [Thermoanaerobaculia bacterium]